MIHEFAVDPKALGNWQNFRYLIEKFGVEHGRLISRFPGKWKRMVYQACDDCPDMEKKRIVEGLAQVDSKLFAAGRNYSSTEAWGPNALASHSDLPFQAIISVASEQGGGDVLDVDNLSDSNVRWNVDRGGIVPRTAEDIAQASEKLLNCSSHVVLVDPYYSEAAKYGKPLARLIECANAGCSQLKRMEYHTCSRVSADHFSNGLEKQRRHLNIPAGVNLVFVRWKEFDEGENLHPRYILTERGGIRYDHGLEEGEPGETTDVECLSRTTYGERWAQYNPDSGTYDLVDAWIVTAESVKPAVWTDGVFKNRV